YRVDFYLGPRHAVDAAELSDLGARGARLAEHGQLAEEALGRLRSWLSVATLALDGLLGIGARGALRPPLDQAAALVNAARRAGSGRLVVLAVDIPSGIDADDGQVVGEAIRADVTAALGAVKAGLLRFPAAEGVGRLI